MNEKNYIIQEEMLLDSEEILAENWRFFAQHSTFQGTKSVIE